VELLDQSKRIDEEREASEERCGLQATLNDQVDEFVESRTADLTVGTPDDRLV